MTSSTGSTSGVHGSEQEQCQEPAAPEQAVESAASPSATKRPAQPANPLHGVTLEKIVTDLSAYYGWDGLGQRIHIRCFVLDPSVASSLKFLRKTPWAREKVESLYLFMLREMRRAGLNQPRNPVPPRQ